jgi:ORF6N domain
MMNPNILPTCATIQARVFSLPLRPTFMLVPDLAEFYQVTHHRVMEQMRRNQNRFPDDFTFQLSPTEIEHLIAQNARLNRTKRGVLVAFTREGALQLSSVLTGAIADEVSVTIIRAFAEIDRRASEASNFMLMKLQSEVRGKRGLRSRVVDASREGWTFDQLVKDVNPPRHKVIAEIAICLAMGLIPAPLAGTPFANQLPLFA